MKLHQSARQGGCCRQVTRTLHAPLCLFTPIHIDTHPHTPSHTRAHTDTRSHPTPMRTHTHAPTPTLTPIAHVRRVVQEYAEVQLQSPVLHSLGGVLAVVCMGSNHGHLVGGGEPVGKGPGEEGGQVCERLCTPSHRPSFLRAMPRCRHHPRHLHSLVLPPEAPHRMAHCALTPPPPRNAHTHAVRFHPPVLFNAPHPCLRVHCCRQQAMHDDIWVPPDGRREVGVVLYCQGVVPPRADVGLLASAKVPRNLCARVCVGRRLRQGICVRV